MFAMYYLVPVYNHPFCALSGGLIFFLFGRGHIGTEHTSVKSSRLKVEKLLLLEVAI